LCCSLGARLHCVPPQGPKGDRLPWAAAAAICWQGLSGRACKRPAAQLLQLPAALCAAKGAAKGQHTAPRVH
jgi:hypothetical protein